MLNSQRNVLRNDEWAAERITCDGNVLRVYSRCGGRSGHLVVVSGVRMVSRFERGRMTVRTSKQRVRELIEAAATAMECPSREVFTKSELVRHTINETLVTNGFHATLLSPYANDEWFLWVYLPKQDDIVPCMRYPFDWADIDGSVLGLCEALCAYQSQLCVG